ncbi:MAG: hypothetical protein ACI4PF_00090 [Christensenellales bacterium]
MEKKIYKPKSCRECPCYREGSKSHCGCLPTQTFNMKSLRLGIEDKSNDEELFEKCPIGWDKE